MAGKSWSAIAKALRDDGTEISGETVRRWSLSDDWAAEYDARRAEIDRATIGAQVAIVELSWDAVRRVLRDPKASHNERLNAAALGLKHLGPAVKSEVAVSGSLLELEAEIARLRAARGG